MFFPSDNKHHTNYDTEVELPEIFNNTLTIENEVENDSLTTPHTDPSNPFAFTLEQLVAVVEQKRLDFISQMGGIHGIAKGLHSNIQKGIAWSESNLSYIRMYDLQHSKSIEGIEEFYDSHLPLSLHDSETFVQRRQVFGSNILPKIEEVTLLQLMWEAFQDKILILLTASALISLAVGIYEDSTRIEYDAAGNRIPGVRWVEGVAIILAVVLVVSVGSVNDYQKEKQFRSLNSKKDDRQVSAIRSGKNIFLSVYDVQVGDILKLEPGEIICADGIFIEGHNVKCDESASTGESEAVRKISWQDCFQEKQVEELAVCSNRSVSTDATANSDSLNYNKSTATSLEYEDSRADPFLISGSKVLEGMCTYIVTAVGPNSWHGRTMMALRTKKDNTPLQDKLDVLATNIAKCGLTAAGILFSILAIRTIVGYATGKLSTVPTEIVSHVMQVVITTITVIVVAVPEGLPLAVTLALAYATKRMLKDNNLVRVLAACETMGNATTICSDKTGTLTQNKMAVVAGTFGSSFRFLKDPPLSRFDLIDAQHIRERLPIPIKNFINQAIVSNSTVSLNTNAIGDVSLVGNKTETALLQFADNYMDCEPFDLLKSYWHVEAVFPFSSAQKAMATVLRIPLDNGTHIYRVHIKGASEVLLGHCSHIISMHDPSYDHLDPVSNLDNYNIQTRLMTGSNKDRLYQIIQSYATRCLRTITLCYQDFNEWPSFQNLCEIMELGQLTFVGIVGIEDTLRHGVTNAVAACQNAGVVVRMVTGDNMLTAKSIARQCGIYIQGSIAMDGPTFRKLKQAERDRILPRLRVLARSSPEDKRLLVNSLRNAGEIVAVTGDGTNDGPALKAADVGFSMGISGTEVAKEASSIILMDDNFSSIVHAIAWGRCVNDSVKKFLQFQLTINFTAVLLTMISAMVSEEQTSILSAVQLLWVNLIMDTFAALALATDAPTLDLLNRQPERRTAPLIDACMWKMIVFESVYQLSVMLTLLYTDVLHLSNSKAKLQTVIFTTFVFCQIFNEVNCRRIDNGLNIFKGVKHNKFFLLIFTLSVTGQVFIVQYGGAAFQTVPLDANMWVFSLFIGLLSIPIGALIRLIPDQFVLSIFSNRSRRNNN